MLLSELASVVSACAAAIAAGISLWTVQSTKRLAAEARANEFVRQAIALAISNPKLSTEPGKELEHQYEWYCQYVMMMCDEILRTYPDDERWRNYCRTQLRYISDEIKYWEQSDLEFFGKALVQLRADVLKEN